MRKILQAGFGNPLGAELLGFLRDECRFDGIRLHASDYGLIEEVQEAGLWPVALVKTMAWADYVPEGVEVEFVPVGPENEDLPEPEDRITPDVYADQVHEALDRWAGRLWIGGVSNLHEKGLRYLSDLAFHLGQDIQYVAGFTAHRYSRGNNRLTPHPKSVSRGHEIERLKAMTGGKPWALSEVGYCDGRRISSHWFRRLLGLRDRWSRETVAHYLTMDLALYRDLGAAWVSIYQISDGPTGDSCEGTYGIRAADGTWKPAAFILKTSV